MFVSPSRSLHGLRTNLILDLPCREVSLLSFLADILQKSKIRPPNRNFSTCLLKMPTSSPQVPECPRVDRQCPMTANNVWMMRAAGAYATLFWCRELDGDLITNYGKGGVVTVSPTTIKLSILCILFLEYRHNATLRYSNKYKYCKQYSRHGRRLRLEYLFRIHSTQEVLQRFPSSLGWLNVDVHQ